MMTYTEALALLKTLNPYDEVTAKVQSAYLNYPEMLSGVPGVIATNLCSTDTIVYIDSKEL